jgi:Carboxypeptidase regulatory-like domain/TonB dependent receptor
MHFCGAVKKHCFLLLLLFSLVANFTWAQSETATVSGQVVDPSGLNIAGAQVKLVDIDRDTSANVISNNIGLYTFQSVRPGRYRMEVTAAGFKVVNVTGLIVNVQDHLEQNFKLAVGSVSESVTVEAGALTVNTQDATVSTVVDRQFAENLPMNGRSFQTLIELTPGVVLTPSTPTDSGQFSINGQRANANYWMVDGVSANIGISPYNTPGNGVGGALGSFSAQGGTNSLVSVDAMQEFRIQTSSYAPEFGRTPGGQISIVTRGGTNQFHGTLFDYFRNDVLDANDWFAGFNDLPKPEERQNDFGGTFAGPIAKDRTFFFFSYEGLRLRLPQVAETTVPDLSARQSATPSIQPYLNAFPIPNGVDLGSGIAKFNASFSNSSTLDAYSIRVDQKVGGKASVFGRYNRSPSEITQRGYAGADSLSTVTPAQITTQTATVGGTWLITPTATDDLRFNYSRTNAFSYNYLDSLGGAVPLTSLPVISPYNVGNADFNFAISTLQNSNLGVGQSAHNLQRQINIVDTYSLQKGSHSLKFGVDFRRLSPLYDPPIYSQEAFFLDVPSAESGSVYYDITSSGTSATVLFHNLGVFAQDSWRIAPRLTLTYGLRWDIDFAPSSVGGPSLIAVTGFNLNDLSNLAIAPSGTPPFNSRYGNIAPRFGVAYQLSQSQGWQTVLRVGFGQFFDLATQEVGNTLLGYYPFGAQDFILGTAAGGTATFPLSSTEAPSITPASLATGTLFAFDPHLQLPYTLEWNAALEQGLGKSQTLSASYIGSIGRRLIQTAYLYSPTPEFYAASLVSNSASSEYNALQVQFQRHLSQGLQVLASYTWAHSIDDASAGSYGNPANTLAPAFNPNANRGPSDFDIRNAFTAGVTYDLPASTRNGPINLILGGWSTENIVQVRSALPVDVYEAQFYTLTNASASVRPDIVPGQPFYLHGAQCASLFQGLGELAAGVPCPGGMGFNPNAFTPPPTDPNTGYPLRQGDLGRNALRGFGAWQWDFAVHRDFPVHESVKLQFRAEMFNVLNHPNFASPLAALNNSPALFGLSTQMLGRSLDQNTGGGGFSALYQIGGPRSIQLALKLMF